MSQDSSSTYLKYANLEDMLKVILFSAQSPIGMVPMLYHIIFKDQNILFIETGAINTIVHYLPVEEKPTHKFIELKQLTGKYEFVDSIGSDTQAIYLPILKLEKSTFDFPL